MPPYLSTPFGNRTALITGKLGYSLGKPYGPLRFQVTGVALTSNVATVNVLWLEGFLPVGQDPSLVGRSISIQGTQQGSGEFNVSNATIASATINQTTGVGTITFALSGSNFAQAGDGGQAIIDTFENPETVVQGTTGLQFAIPQNHNTIESDRVVSWSYLSVSAPSSWTVALQVADVDEDLAYTNLDTGTVVTAGGETRVLSIPGSTNFARVKVTALSGGTLPTAIARIHV